jgi:hypothetical protein
LHQRAPSLFRRHLAAPLARSRTLDGQQTTKSKPQPNIQNGTHPFTYVPSESRGDAFRTPTSSNRIRFADLYTRPMPMQDSTRSNRRARATSHPSQKTRRTAIRPHQLPVRRTTLCSPGHYSRQLSQPGPLASSNTAPFAATASTTGAVRTKLISTESNRTHY